MCFIRVACARRTSGEATAQLSACLTAASIGNLFMLRHLGATIDERETLKVLLCRNPLRRAERAFAELLRPLIRNKRTYQMSIRSLSAELVNSPSIALASSNGCCGLLRSRLPAVSIRQRPRQTSLIGLCACGR